MSRIAAPTSAKRSTNFRRNIVTVSNSSCSILSGLLVANRRTWYVHGPFRYTVRIESIY